MLDPSQIPVSISIEPGDCLFFDARLIHSGMPIVAPKCFVTLTHGLPNGYSYDHYFFTRYIRVDQGLTDLDPELVDILRAKGLYLEGSDDESLRQQFTEPYAALEGTFDPDQLSRDYIRDI